MCLLDEVLEYATSNSIQNEYMLQMYYPELKNENIRSKEEFLQKKEEFIARDREYITPDVDKMYKKVENENDKKKM